MMTLCYHTVKYAATLFNPSVFFVALPFSSIFDSARQGNVGFDGFILFLALKICVCPFELVMKSGGFFSVFLCLVTFSSAVSNS